MVSFVLDNFAVEFPFHFYFIFNCLNAVAPSINQHLLNVVDEKV